MIDLSLSEVARGKVMMAAKEGNAIPLEQANPTLWAKIQRAKSEAAQGERRS